MSAVRIIRYRYFRQKLEAWIWLVVLLSMVLTQPSSGNHFILCPLAHMGIQKCPGCGVGRSMILALHGNVPESLCLHPLGLLALVVISLRIYELLFSNPKYIKP